MNSAALHLSLPALILALFALAGACLAGLLGAELLEFTFAFAVLALIPFAARAGRGKPDPFRPFIGLLALLYLYSVSTLLFVEAAGATYYGEPVVAVDLSTYRTACLLAAAGISLGALIGQSGRVPMTRLSSATAAAEHTALIWLAAGLAALAFPLIAGKFAPWLATSYGEVALSLRVERLAEHSAGIKETLLETLPITIVLCGCTALMFDSRQAGIMRLVAATIFGLYCVSTLLSGWRGQLMSAALISGIYFHYKVRPIRWYQMIIAALIVYVLINVISVVRATSAPMEMIALLIDAVSDRGFGFLALSQSGELATSTNLLRLISGIRLGESEFGLGSVTLGQLAAFLPRPLMPSRPPIASELFVMTFYPGVLESGGGYGFFMVQDGYWDFGLPGVFFYCLAFGLAVETLYRHLRVRMRSDVVIFLYAILYSQLVLSVVRNGIFASLKAALIAIIPIGVMVVMSHLIVASARSIPARAGNTPA